MVYGVLKQFNYIKNKLSLLKMQNKNTFAKNSNVF